MHAIDDKPDFILMYANHLPSIIWLLHGGGSLREWGQSGNSTGDIIAHALPTLALVNETMIKFTSMIHQVFPDTLVLPVLGRCPVCLSACLPACLSVCLHGVIV